ncbi:MAG: peptidylprolyl isomerase [Thermoanaerobaculia bacterium]
MLKKISPRTTLFSLGLALLLSGWTACKGTPDKTADKAGTPAAGTSDTAASPNAATPAAPGMARSGTAGPGQLGGQPGATGLPGQPVSKQPVMPVEKIPAVVARVNGQEIKKAELMDGAQMVQMRLAQAGQPVTASTDFYHHVLDELIAIILLQQDAKAQGITASDQEVQQMVAARKQNFPNEEAYKKALAQAGVTEAKLREQARDTIAVQKYVQTKLAPQATVSDQAAKDFYEKNKGQMQVPERLHLRHIFVLIDPKATPADREKAKQKAEGLLKRVQGGEDFAKVATEASDDPGSKSRGGDIGLVGKGQAPPAFEAAAFALKKPNDMSPVVESNLGYHIIQLLERKEPSTVPYEQVKGRIEQMLKQQQVQKLFQVRADQLRAKGKVETYI